MDAVYLVLYLAATLMALRSLVSLMAHHRQQYLAEKLRHRGRSQSARKAGQPGQKAGQPAA